MVNVVVHRWLACITVCLGFALSSNTGFGQSFLDKLESVVREKLNTPAADQKPSKTPAANPPTNASNSAGAELPAPNRTKQDDSAANNANGKSILENRAVVPAPKRTEELQLAPSTEIAPEAEPAGVYLGLEVEELVGGGIGVRVSSLSDQSPAWKAGFKVGDLLQAIDGHAIADIDDMAERLRRVVPGKPTKFLVKRGGRNIELVAVLQNVALASRLGATTGPSNAPAYLGVLVSDLTPAFKTQFGLGVYSGAAVTNVAPGSPASLAGIQPGDAIVEINGTAIDNGNDLLRWMAGAQVGQPAELLVYRGTLPSTISLVISSEMGNSAVSERTRRSSRPTFNGATDGPNNALQVEVEQLRAELQQTQQQLLQTQKRLEQVLQQIEQSGDRRVR